MFSVVTANDFEKEEQSFNAVAIFILKISICAQLNINHTRHA